MRFMVNPSQKEDACQVLFSCCSGQQGARASDDLYGARSMSAWTGQPAEWSPEDGEQPKDVWFKKMLPPNLHEQWAKEESPLFDDDPVLTQTRHPAVPGLDLSFTNSTSSSKGAAEADGKLKHSEKADGKVKHSEKAEGSAGEVDQPQHSWSTSAHAGTDFVSAGSSRSVASRGRLEFRDAFNENEREIFALFLKYDKPELDIGEFKQFVRTRRVGQELDQRELSCILRALGKDEKMCMNRDDILLAMRFLHSYQNFPEGAEKHLEAFLGAGCSTTDTEVIKNQYQVLEEEREDGNFGVVTGQKVKAFQGSGCLDRLNLHVFLCETLNEGKIVRSDELDFIMRSSGILDPIDPSAPVSREDLKMAIAGWYIHVARAASSRWELLRTAAVRGMTPKFCMSRSQLKRNGLVENWFVEFLFYMLLFFMFGLPILEIVIAMFPGHCLAQVCFGVQEFCLTADDATCAAGSFWLGTTIVFLVLQRKLMKDQSIGRFTVACVFLVILFAIGQIFMSALGLYLLHLAKVQEIECEGMVAMSVLLFLGPCLFGSLGSNIIVHQVSIYTSSCIAENALLLKDVDDDDHDLCKGCLY